MLPFHPCYLSSYTKTNNFNLKIGIQIEVLRLFNAGISTKAKLFYVYVHILQTMSVLQTKGKYLDRKRIRKSRI